MGLFTQTLYKLQLIINSFNYLYQLNHGTPVTTYRQKILNKKAHSSMLALCSWGMVWDIIFPGKITLKMLLIKEAEAIQKAIPDLI